MRLLFRRIWYLLNRRRFDAELAEEMAFHRSLTTPAAFGSAALAADRARDVWMPPALQGLGQDVRLAMRTLRRTPLVSTVAVLSLALGIGANTAIFSLVDSLVLRKLPVASPQRLVVVSTPRAIAMGSVAFWSSSVWNAVQGRIDTLAEGAAWSTDRLNLSASGETNFIDGSFVSGSFFRLLGVTPLVGRMLTDADDRRGGGADGPVAVISYGFWQQRFGGAADIIGRTLTIERVPVTIVGVAPPSFFGLNVGRRFDVFLPIGDEPILRGRDTRTEQPAFLWLNIVARLRDDQSIESFAAALKAAEPDIRASTMPPTIPKQLAGQYLAGHEGFAAVPAATGTSGLRQRYAQPLLTILAVVGLVLLVACANIANLLLARAAARSHDTAIRRALGASRWRLARQLLIESFLLASIGAAGALAFASAATRLLVAQLSTRTNTVFLDVSLNLPVLAFTLAVTTATVLVFGLVPAMRASTIAPLDAIKEHGRGTVGGHATTTNVLVAAQVAMSIVLVVAAALFLRTFASLQSRPLGFDAGRILVTYLEARKAHIEPNRRLATFDAIRDRIAATPGVDLAALSIVAPIQGGGITDQIEISGGVAVPSALVGGIGNVYGNVVSPGWFRTVGIPLLAGRDFSDADRKGGASVAIVNEALSRAFLNGANPIGHSLKHLRGDMSQIVGLVADSTYGSLREPATPTYYEPLSQVDLPIFALSNINVVARTAGPPALMAKSVSAAVGRVNADIAVTPWPVWDQLKGSLAQERLTAVLAGFFGILALVLAGLGLYGVTSYAVERRTSEIGVRLALGASPFDVLRMVLSNVGVLVGTGIVGGVAISLAASRLVASLLYGVAPRDPAAVLAAVAAMVCITVIAAWRPARRAARIDPVVALRHD